MAMAVVLLTAAGLKAHQLMAMPIAGTGLLESRWFMIGVVEFELLFSLWLLSTLLPNVFGTGCPLAGGVPTENGTRRVPDTFSGDEGFWTWLASTVLFSAFGCVSLWKALGGEATCGCFGSLEVHPWFTTAMDWAFVAALIRFRPQSPRPRKFPSAYGLLRVGSVVVIWALVGGPAGFAMATFQPTTLSDAGSITGEGHVVVSEPERWVGMRLPLLNYIDIGEQLVSGEWTVVFYRSGCPDCASLLRDYKRRASEEVFTSRVALVEVPPYGDADDGSDLPGPNFISGRLSDAREWFIKTPLQVKLADGIVSWQSEQDRDGLALSNAQTTTEVETLLSIPDFKLAKTKRRVK